MLRREGRGTVPVRRFKKPSVEDNVVVKLMERQLAPTARRRLPAVLKQQRFGNFKLLGEFDTHDPDVSDVKLSFLRRRSKVAEIVTAKDIIFALTNQGICAAFNRDTMRRICFMNVQPDEVIRSLFFNKTNRSLITVSVFRADNFSSLRCRSTPLDYIRRGQAASGFPLFESESLSYPGFVEFDDVNSKVLTFSATDSVYKVWDLVNYQHLFTLQDETICEIKISPGIMLVIHNMTKNHSFIPLRILSIETGEVLKSFSHMIHRSKRVEFIEQFNEKLLIKQEAENLQIVDVETSRHIEVPQTQFATPSAFIFLYDSQKFLTFRGQAVDVWDFKGERVSSFSDSQLGVENNTNSIFITSQQDIILSYCGSRGGGVGSIKIAEVLTGKTVAAIAPPEASAGAGPADPMLIDALSEVTALYFNEERNEIVSGTASGKLHVWTC
eukprot:a1775_66.p2 GENE.a1775_66~~a1775_66.p2  ORF type:complete len:451 (+),score=217.77 a1775_66:31-1353(+)